MIQPFSLIRCALFLFILASSCSFAHAQVTPTQDIHPDSLRAEILRLRTDLDVTRANLRISHQKFRSGILVSGIGYSITILGGVLLGSSKYSEWGQPLVVTGGVVGFSGALLLLNSNKFIGRAGGNVARSFSSPASSRVEVPTNTMHRAP